MLSSQSCHQDHRCTLSCAYDSANTKDSQRGRLDRLRGSDILPSLYVVVSASRYRPVLQLDRCKSGCWHHRTGQDEDRSESVRVNDGMAKSVRNIQPGHDSCGDRDRNDQSPGPLRSTPLFCWLWYHCGSLVEELSRQLVQVIESKSLGDVNGNGEETASPGSS